MRAWKSSLGILIGFLGFSGLAQGQLDTDGRRYFCRCSTYQGGYNIAVVTELDNNEVNSFELTVGWERGATWNIPGVDRQKCTPTLDNRGVASCSIGSYDISIDLNEARFPFGIKPVVAVQGTGSVHVAGWYTYEQGPGCRQCYASLYQ